MGNSLHPEQAAPGTGFIAELRLDLIEQEGQVTVAPHLVTHQLGDDLLMGRAQTQPAFPPVGEAEQALAEGLMSACPFP